LPFNYYCRVKVLTHSHEFVGHHSRIQTPSRCGSLQYDDALINTLTHAIKKLAPALMPLKN